MVTEAEARRLRPFMSGIIALAVSLVAAIGWYYLGRPDESAQPVRTVDWAAWVKAGREGGQLELYAPVALPKGWRATSANYVGGNYPAWELGILTKAGRFAGIAETKDSVKTLVAQNIDPKADQGKDVTINGATWQVWTDQGGDYGVALAIKHSDGTSESVLVYGSAPDSEIRDFAATLEPGTGPTASPTP